MRRPRRMLHPTTLQIVPCRATEAVSSPPVQAGQAPEPRALECFQPLVTLVDLALQLPQPFVTMLDLLLELGDPGITARDLLCALGDPGVTTLELDRSFGDLRSELAGFLLDDVKPLLQLAARALGGLDLVS